MEGTRVLVQSLMLKLPTHRVQSPPPKEMRVSMRRQEKILATVAVPEVETPHRAWVSLTSGTTYAAVGLISISVLSLQGDSENA